MLPRRPDRDRPGSALRHHCGMSRPDARLLPAAWRWVVAPVEAALGVVFVALTAHVSATPRPGRTDVAIQQRLPQGAEAEALSRHAVALGSPYVTALIAGSLAVTFLVARRPRSAVACVLAPVMAGILTEAVLKPVTGAAHAYPSGHATGAASAATLFVLAVGPSGTLGRHLPRALQLLVSGMAGLAVALTAVALVIRHMHVATDSVGGVLVGVIVTLAVVMVCEGRTRRIRIFRPTTTLTTSG